MNSDFMLNVDAGLCPSELPSLRNYEHFRQSQSPENLLELRRAEIRSSGSLLDSLEGDVPKHAWGKHLLYCSLRNTFFYSEENIMNAQNSLNDFVFYIASSQFY